MNKILKKIKDKGIKGVFISLSSRFYSKNYLMKLNIEKLQIKKTIYKIKKINREIIEELKESTEEFTHTKYKQFYEKIDSLNNIGYVIYYEDEIAGYSWTMTEEIKEGLTGYESKLSHDELYIYDVYIFEKYRKFGLGTNLIDSILQNSLGKYKIIYVIVDNINFKSKGMFYKIGFENYGKIFILKLFGKKFRKVVINNGN
ncbi:GNAT family N-acetyltransferase [Miniphocaeibacter massiliensis]|uniref:GNAT family N-acetyltransferase n=1 Tax=Miniphocaeibacter massiliensis TaxID=2041841 RepID=UPI000C1B91DE|nr:GNAT family N-acetyltransferase [Miniphocaeibacter massiliensis]